MYDLHLQISSLNILYLHFWGLHRYQIYVPLAFEKYKTSVFFTSSLQ